VGIDQPDGMACPFCGYDQVLFNTEEIFSQAPNETGGDSSQGDVERALKRWCPNCGARLITDEWQKAE
jgi:RNA polymerase subunit RPABC4/transcription elongation factor Spt4